ncbi:sporulation integral membrane protein YtvI [Alkaliphilus crotonatoxidans]
MKDYRNYLPNFIRLLIAVLIFLTLFFWGGKIILMTLPFLLGWLVAGLIEPLIVWMQRRLGIKRALSSLIGVVLFVILVLTIFTTIGTLITLQMMALYQYLPEYANLIYERGQSILKEIQDYYTLIPSDIAQTMLTAFDGVVKAVTGQLSIFLGSFFSALSIVPELIIFTIVAIISAYLISRDRQLIYNFIKLQIPPDWFPKLTIIKNDLILAVGGYIKAQLILMIPTFIVCSIGLLLIRMEFALLIALTASLLDALPVLGTGTVFVPIIVWQTIKGNYLVAAFLGVIYGITVILRRFLEPKVLATQIGFHPLSVLLAMYIGLRLIGFAGMILGPIALILLLTMQKLELLPKWRRPPDAGRPLE